MAFEILADDYTPTRGQMAMLPNNNHPGSGCSCEYCMRRWPEQLPGDALQAIEVASEDCPAETRLALHTLRSAVNWADPAEAASALFADCTCDDNHLCIACQALSSKGVRHG